MNTLREAISLLTQPPGNVAYFLVTLFALQQALVATWAAVRQGGRATLPARRWLWAVGGLLVGRVVLILVSLLSYAGFVTPALILPPLERWLELVAVLIVMWASLLSGHLSSRQTWLWLGVVGLSAIPYIYTASHWPDMQGRVAFNTSLWGQAWEWLTLLTLTAFLIGIVVLRPSAWAWLVGMVSLWTLGHIAQWLWPDTTSHIPGWLRLSALITWPMLPILVHDQLRAAAPPAHSPTVPAVPDADRLREVLHIVETARQLEPSLIVASSKLAELTGAEMCALALAEAGNPLQLQVVAVHPPTGLLEPPKLDVSRYPPLQAAYEANRPRIFQPPRAPEWLPDLYRQIGLQGEGPLIAIPMVHDGKPMGLLLLGNPTRRQPWPTHRVEGYRLIAALMATAIARAREQGSDKGTILNRIRVQDVERQRLEMELQQSHQQIETLKNRLTALVVELKSRDRELQRLRREVESKSSSLSQTELSFWQNEVKELADEREKLMARVEELERDRRALLQEHQRLVAKLSETKEALDDAEASVARLQQRVAELEQQTAQVERVVGSPQPGFGVIVTDAQGRVERVDEAVNRLLNRPSEALLGTDVTALYADEAWTALIRELLSDAPSARRWASYILADENLRADLVTMTNASGQVTGLTVLLSPLEMGEDRRELIVSLAHEFRTPMTAITGYTDLLLDEQAGILTEMQQQFLERVKANVEQMGHLLNDLIRTVSPESQPLDAEPQAVELPPVIEEALMGLSATLRERKLTVKLDLAPDLPKVRADRDSLYQIMLRLLSNATLCSREGTAIVVRARPEDEEEPGKPYVLIAVEDTGGGIAVEDYGRVFRRFYRANQPLIQGMGEKGIGMALVKMLVEANGGRIWVKSQPGVGSTFSLILPAAEA